MKKINILAALVLVLVTACAGNLQQVAADANSTTGNTTTKAPGTTTGGTTVAMANMVVSDATTTVLGNLMSAGPLGVEVMNTTTNYLYFLDWSGAPSNEWLAYYPTFYYSNTGCVGLIYMTSGSINTYTKINGKQVLATPTTQIAVPKVFNADGSAVVAGSKNYSSFWPMNGSCSNTAGTAGIGVEVQVTSRTTVGLPATVTAPISFQ